MPIPLPNLDLVIFDCDGVLVDSEVISNEVLARELTAVGLPTTLLEARRDYQGLLLREVLIKAEARLQRPLPDGWLSNYEQVRADAFREGLRPVAGAAELVQRIRRAGISVCVASQGALRKTALSLQLTGLSHLFATEAIFSAAQVERGKPFPDLFLHAAAVIGAEPARCVVIEDTPSGARAAVAAGMRVLGFGADSDPEALAAAGAEVFMSLGDVPSLLGLD
jgi:HAD superfamily hydrolase (TIGR01509 family)